MSKSIVMLTPNRLHILLLALDELETNCEIAMQAVAVVSNKTDVDILCENVMLLAETDELRKELYELSIP